MNNDDQYLDTLEELLEATEMIEMNPAFLPSVRIFNAKGVAHDSE